MDLLERFNISPEVLGWVVAAAIALGIGSLIVLPLLVIAIPRDYFVGAEPPKAKWSKGHPWLYLVWRVVRNGIGVVMVLLGIVMLVGPGQGVLAIVVGLMLVDFPGKRRFEQRLICRPTIHRHLNWLRARAKKPPLSLPALPKSAPKVSRAPKSPGAPRDGA